MNTEQNKDEQLIRWLEGDLSGQELSAFEASSEFLDYQKILDATQDIKYPEMDEKAVFASIQEKISPNQDSIKKKAKVKPLRRWILAVAAISILSFAVLSIVPGGVNITSDTGQFVSHTLPDGSEININGKSQLKYKSNFSENRTLKLSGEAFFNVKKGNSFTVETGLGKVTVLGTSFNIFSRDDIFVVSCKTGKVKVDSKNQSHILEKGERIRIENNNPSKKELLDDAKIGNWVNGQSYFSGASLEEVALSISSIYDTNINLPTSYQNKRFTGSFVHNDFKKALKMVFSPMGIPYSIDDQGMVVISE